MVLKSHSLKQSQEFLEVALVGNQIDSVSFHGLWLVISFLNMKDGTINAPSTFHLSTNNSIFVGDFSEKSSTSIYKEIDAVNTRKLYADRLIGLIGQDVTGACISENGMLTIECGNAIILVLRETDEFEEVWEITSDTPDPNKPHNWSLVLTDESELIVQKPRG